MLGTRKPLELVNIYSVRDSERLLDFSQMKDHNHVRHVLNPCDARL